jgi:flagellar biosynthetic protein FliS
MPEPQQIRTDGADAGASRARDASGATAVVEATVPEQYELLLSKLARAERELASSDVVGRSGHLEEASGIVFDLLYSLDFKHGGELVPRLAALYGYIANELLTIGKSGDRIQLAHVRDMVNTLRQSWYDGQTV